MLYYKKIISILLLFFLQLPLQATSTNTAIVFLHGINSGTYDWKPFADTYFDNQYNTMRFSDSTTISYNLQSKSPIPNAWLLSYYSKKRFTEAFYGHLDLYSNRLGQMLDKITELSGKTHFIIIAHSMGGLVARNHMVSNQANWDRITHIITLGTPNEGVKISIGIVGHLRDLKTNSKFLQRLDQRWEHFSAQSKPSKWGVIGAYSKFILFKKRGLANGSAIDYSGPGWVTIESSIPFGEWQNATQMLEKVAYNTPNFSLRCLVKAHHEDLLNHPVTYNVVDWVLNKNSTP